MGTKLTPSQKSIYVTKLIPGFGFFFCSVLRVSLISLIAWAKWVHICFWNKWCFLCWFFPVWIKVLSQQWLEVSFLGAPEWDDPFVLGQVGGVWRLTSLDWTRNPGSIRFPSSPPPEVLGAKGSISPRKLLTHFLWVPDPLDKHPWQNCTNTPYIDSPNPMFEPLCCTFKWLYWTRKGNSSLKSGDPMVPDGSAFTALPPVSYLFSFSNNTLTAWQLSRAV